MHEMTPIERLLLRVVVAEDDCWLIEGRRGKHPTISATGRVHTASRLIYERFIGTIPKHLMVCHTCDERGCINPAHFFLGTGADNSFDMTEKGRQARGALHSQAKLTDEQVLAIRADTRSNRATAPDYGVSPDTIRLIRNRKTWRHI